MKLSIIMPCYNVGETLARALDSIAMQRAFGDYEVVIVDDGSTDNTAEVAKQYADRLPIVYTRNNKNSGNAHSFFVGLNTAKGDYFCVLDGDDYYTIADKLYRQVRFLDSDVDRHYVAVATDFIVDFGDGTVHIPDVSVCKEFTYADYLQSRFAYCHTATYVYRNIFREKPLPFFDQNLYRGDSPRTLFHLMYSGKKVKVLHFIGSAYSYTFNGIWTSVDEKEHYRHMISYYKGLREDMNTQFEKDCIEAYLVRQQNAIKNVNEEDRHHYSLIKIDDAICEIRLLAKRFAFSKRDYVFRELFWSEYLDSLAASLGFIARIHHPEWVQREKREDSIAIVIPDLNPGGGGVYPEIESLIKIHADYDVTLIKTDSGDLSDSVKERLAPYTNLKVAYFEDVSPNPVEILSNALVKAAPAKIYYYCSHSDAIACALMDNRVAENICLFSFDHGFVLGLSNPNLTTILAKRTVDYYLLQRYFPNKVAYGPAWCEKPVLPEGLSYEPFKDHESIITASGAARYYKLVGSTPCSYLELIVDLLEKTGGKHYHFGAIPDDVAIDLELMLSRKNISRDRFVIIEWSDNIPEDLLRFNVDLFVEPFALVSYKLTLEVISAGIPVIAYDGLRRVQVADFIPDDAIRWSTKEQFIDIVSSIGADQLLAMSKSAVELFESEFDFDVVSKALLTGEYMEPLARRYFTDDEIHDVMDYMPLFEMRTIAMMDTDRVIMPKSAQAQAPAPAPAQNNNIDAEKLMIEMQAIKSSKAYKLGTTLARPLRKLRRLIKRK